MGTAEQELLKSCLARIKKDLGVKVLSLKTSRGVLSAGTHDGEVRIRFGQGSIADYQFEVKRHLKKFHLPQILSSRHTQILVLSEYINPEFGHLLKDKGIQFADACGNMYLRIGKKMGHFILAHKPETSSFKKWVSGSAFHFSGSKVLYVLLARPKEKPTVRKLAAQANVGFSTAAMVLRDLTTQRLISVTRNKIVILSPKELLEKWLLSYSTYLRPKISIGFYRFAEKDVHEFLNKLTKSVRSSKLGIAVTGDFAAAHFTKHLKGGKACIFLEKEYLNQPRGVPSLMLTHQPEGIEILNYFCPAIVVQDSALTRQDLIYAHPLLVYAELLHSGTERQVETASILYDETIRKILES